ncbi:hypothetical protein ACHAQJ_006646, partial [Trichoderma viride]
GQHEGFEQLDVETGLVPASHLTDSVLAFKITRKQCEPQDGDGDTEMDEPVSPTLEVIRNGRRNYTTLMHDLKIFSEKPASEALQDI